MCVCSVGGAEDHRFCCFLEIFSSALEKRTRRGGGGDALDFPLSLSQIISELNKGGLTAAVATGLFLLHLLLCIFTHTAALCPRGLNHLSSPPPPRYSVSLLLSLSAGSITGVCTWVLTTNKQSLKC